MNCFFSFRMLNNILNIVPNYPRKLENLPLIYSMPLLRSVTKERDLNAVGINLFNLKAVHDNRSESMLETLLVTGFHLSVSTRCMMIDMDWYVRSPAGNGASFF